MTGSLSIRASNALVIVQRVLITLTCVTAFLPAFNPAGMSGLFSNNASLFTNALSYNSIGSVFIRALRMEWIDQSTITTIYIGALVTFFAVAGLAAAACLGFGNTKMRRLGVFIALGSAAAGIGGTTILRTAYGMLSGHVSAYRVEPINPVGIVVFYVLFAVVLLASLAAWFALPKPAEKEKYNMDSKYRLFLMILPFLVLTFLFAYLPLWGWRYAFFNFQPGLEPTMDNFVGFRWFEFLFNNPARRADIGRVLTNTFALSGIGIATSWLPMVFAIFLAEIKANRPRRMVQTLTTIPNFISWVLVYSVAFAIFSTEGFLNWMLANFGVIESGMGTNHLMDNSSIWLKMWLWGTWKGLGWSAIIYIAGISSIDPQLYEAATVDGAGRFRRMWHITVPGLTSTFFVLLLLAIANMLSNGLEQYLVFYNPANRSTIEVLDLYIYNQGLASQTSSTVPMATIMGMLKSIVSVVLLFSANKVSKLLRGESIV
jgi:putative aldouronate transport system permease protein